MARYDDGTSMGGENRAFPPTRWTEIVDLKMSDDDQKALIANELLKRYWKPVYCYLRRKGYDNETAKDLTQGFFQEVVLGRGLLEKASQAKGRFRTFLLTAIDRYAIDIRRYETTSKRKPDGQLFQLSDAEIANIASTIVDATAEQSFNYAWISELLDRVLSEVKDELLHINKEIHWHVFEDRILQPLIASSSPPSLKDLCDKYGIETEKVASNMIITVRRRLRGSLRCCLRQFTHSDSQVEQEILDMLKVFSEK